MAKNTKQASKPVTRANVANTTPDVQKQIGDAVLPSEQMLEIVEATKEAFRNAEDRDLMLSDNFIAEAIKRAKNWDDWTDDEKLEHLKTVESQAKRVAISDPGLSVLVKKLEQNTEAMAELEKDVEATMRTKVNRIRLYSFFRGIYTKSELDSMPYPGTDKDTVWLGNYRPDITTDEKTGLKVKWTDDFVDTMSRGKYIASRIDEIETERKVTNASDHYKGWSDTDLDSEKGRLTGERNNYRSMVRGAIEVHHNFEGIRGLPEVDISWKRSKDTKNYISMPVTCGNPKHIEQITTAPKCVYIQAKGDGQTGKVYSQSQLIAFDVQAAAANGGTLKALTDTVRKEPKNKSGAGALAGYSGDGSDMDGDQAYSVGNLFTNYINATANVAALRQIMADPKAEHRKDWLENVVTIGDWADRVRKQFREQIKRLTEATIEPGEESEAA